MSLEITSYIVASLSAFVALISILISLRIFRSIGGAPVKRPRTPCDVCQGDGEITIVRHHTPEEQDDVDTSQRITITCPRCNGAGYLSDE